LPELNAAVLGSAVIWLSFAYWNVSTIEALSAKVNTRTERQEKELTAPRTMPRLIASQ